jgi:hypothetical protein
MTTFDERYQKDPNIVFRNIVGEAILVPVRKNLGDLESIYALNETAARAWELLDGQRTLADIRDQITAEYEATPEEVGQDLLELFDQLVAIKAVARA